jgi:hypothetical protein
MMWALLLRRQVKRMLRLPPLPRMMSDLLRSRLEWGIPAALQATQGESVPKVASGD